MLRVARTYELCITRHKPVAVDTRQRPRLEAEEMFRAKHGYLALELWGKDKELAGCVRPQFFTRSGEEVELPNGFDEAVQAVTRGVNCVACSHPHFSRLVAQQQPEDDIAGCLGGLHDHAATQLFVGNGAGKHEEVCK